MSWVTVVWSMTLSACLMVAGLHTLIWLKRPNSLGNLLFALAALAIGFLAVCEFWMMRSQTTAEFGEALRWLHVPAWFAIVTLCGFLRLHLRTGRQWLLYSIVATRSISLVLDFAFSPNLNFREITSLRHIPFLGESVSVAIGPANPWMLIGQLSLLLVVVYALDITASVWKRGDHRQALMVAGSVSLFFALATTQSIVVLWGVLPMPITASAFYMLIVLAIAFELSREVVQAARIVDELHESERRVTLASETANLGFWSRDFQKQEVWATDNWRALFGIARSESMQTEQLLERIHPADRESVRQAMGAATEAVVPAIEFRLLPCNGQVRWITARFGVERADNGRPVRLHGAAMEITARKHADERFRSAVDAAPSGMILVNAQGHITLVNTQAERIFGYVREELLGRPIETLIPARFSEAHPDHRHSYWAAPGARSMGTGREIYGRRKDGGEVPIEVALSPITTAEGTAVIASIVDITLRHKSEAEAAQQRAELAHLSRITMVGELSGSLAHELTQPLTSILFNARAALRSLEHNPINTEEIREILHDIVEGDKLAADVIQRLRTLLKKEQVEHGPLDINEIVRDVLRLLRTDLMSRAVSVSTELTSSLPKVQGDRVQLQQVLVNLIMNGCDAMEGASGRARELSIRTAAGERGEVSICVVDHGCGIPPADLERIFQPFVTTKTKGTGLGLAVCRSIISAHHGSIRATNNIDGGASIRVTLPSTEPDGTSG